jgi:predicted GH43/DUF377 family glycosyl hydrolase
MPDGQRGSEVHLEPRRYARVRAAVARYRAGGTVEPKKDGSCPCSDETEYEKPVWDGYLADPQVLKTGGEYYAYGTGPGHKGRQFPVLHSKDFANWEFVGNALETLADAKVKAYWAPEVAEKDGKFYLYYAG